MTTAGQGRMAAVLFTDLVGSTELLSRLGEAAYEGLRRAHFAALREAIGRSRGAEVKTTGDGLLATFASAADAVGCAVVMQQAVEVHSRTAGVPLAIRVGVSVGDVVFEDGDVFGTPLVEAARLVAAARGGQVLATALVRGIAGGRSVAGFTDVGCLELKGLPAPVATCEVAWEPLPLSSVPMPALLTDIGRIFVGRQAQVERLEQLWNEVGGGERRAVFVAGEPGIGKTRLAAELAARVHAEGAVVLAGRCDEDLGVPYQPFVEALRHFVDHTPPNDLLQRVGRYGGELTRLLPELTGLIPDLSPPLRSDPETERYRLFDAVASWLGATSEDQPLLLLLDDLQWAAKPTLLLLRHVIQSPDPKRLLVLGTYRDSELSHDHPLPEILADLRRQSGIERVSLSGLDQAAVTAFVEHAAGHELAGGDLALARAVYAETEGNPFFVREVLRHLVETGVVDRQNGGWVISVPVEELGIPAGVREVIGRRLSRLSAEANRTLRVAAVAGTEFELRVIAAAGQFDDDAILSAVEEAMAARLVVEVQGPTPRHRFTHALVRDTLYAEVSAARRKALHGRVAESIEVAHAGHLDDQLPALVHHYARAAAAAAQPAKAVVYATRAGDRALAQLAHDEAVTYYAQALELLEVAGEAVDGTPRLDLLISLGEAQRRAGEPTYRETLLDAARLASGRGDAHRLARAALANNRGIYSVALGVDAGRVAVLEAALDACGPDDSVVRARLLANLGAELAFAGDRDRRLALTGEALAVARRLQDTSTLGHVLLSRAAANYGDPALLSHVLAETAELIAMTEHLGDPFVRALVSYHRHSASYQAGAIEEANWALESLERAAADGGQPGLRWYATYTRAGRLLVGGRLAEAEALARAAMEVGVACGQPDARYVFGTQRFEIRFEQGRLDEVVDRVAEVAEETRRPVTCAVLALAYCELDRDDDARSALQHLMSVLDHVPLDLAWLLTMARGAAVCAHLGEVTCADLVYHLLLPYADQVAGVAATWVGSVAHYLGILATTLSRFDEAEARFAAAEATHARIGAPTWLARTRLEWGRLLLARGQPGNAERAEGLLGQALVTARELGLANVERRVVALLA